jgi:hypothetical protein
VSTPVEIHETTALDVRSPDTGERLGFIIRTGRKEWLAIAVVPKDGRNQMIGLFPKPRRAVQALVENDEELLVGAKALGYVGDATE